MAVKAKPATRVAEAETLDAVDLLDRVIDATPAVRDRWLQVTSVAELLSLARLILDSGFAPKSFSSVASVAAAIALGMEIGLPPVASVQNIASINNRPAIYGDAARGVVEASGLADYIIEGLELDGKTISEIPSDPKQIDRVRANCRVKRRGRPERVSVFSVAQAKRAQLWGKPGPWTQYPERMLMFRARGFALRDEFPDVLRGLKTVEEVRDYSDAEQQGSTPAPAIIDPPKPVAEPDKSSLLKQVGKITSRMLSNGTLTHESYAAVLAEYGAVRTASLGYEQLGSLVDRLGEIEAMVTVDHPSPTGPQQMFTDPEEAPESIRGRL